MKVYKTFMSRNNLYPNNKLELCLILPSLSMCFYNHLVLFTEGIILSLPVGF